MADQLSSEMKENLLKDQQDEITAHYLYTRIASFVKDEENKKIIEAVAEDEFKHYNTLKEITGRELKPQKFKMFVFYWITRVLGVTFGIKFLENSETQAITSYNDKVDSVEELNEIVKDEERHENELINMINEERLNYMGSVVLGLNDALVELTGALAGYTFAFQNTRLIALTGLITGISASLSMAASEYLAKKHEQEENALKSSLYTGIAYVITVAFLVLPFLLLNNPFYGIITTLVIAVLIIFAFNFYVSVANDYNFKKRFLEMAVISLGVAGISFLIGVLIKKFIGIDM
ncbi:MAG: rubrerythrin family protein [Firmicutes bacterium ML8_F2]|nr:MAG: rubrerythrin family protein [Firmicutes bacterium ML8_F2]